MKWSIVEIDLFGSLDEGRVHNEHRNKLGQYAYLLRSL